jgi:hypothetical protein
MQKDIATLRGEVGAVAGDVTYVKVDERTQPFSS